MNTKVGRNDPCPCGSGRKFKHCCGAPSVEPPEVLAWRRMRRLIDENNEQLHRFAMNAYGEQGLTEAWQEFSFGALGELPFSFDSPHIGVFMSWFHNFWSPDPYGDSAVRDKALHGVEPASAYLLQRGPRLDPLQRDYLESCLEAPLSFHRVLEVDAGKGFVLKDLVTHVERTVAERHASESIQVGDVLFAQVVHAGGVDLLECCSAFAFPPIAEIRIAEDCRKLVGRRKRATFPLRERDYEMLEIYHAAIEPLINPRLPTMHNTDGEPFSPRKLVFDIESAEKAFAALRHLDPEEEVDAAAGELRWIEPSKNPRGAMRDKVLAFLQINGSRLTAEVNSEARERRLREIVEKALGAAARYRATEIQSMEYLMNAAREEPEAVPSSESESLASSPELQEFMNDHMKRHYEGWLSDRIPALGGKTPLQAVKTAAGREAVEALLRQIERDAAKLRPPMDPAIVRGLRERLGLA